MSSWLILGLEVAIIGLITLLMYYIIREALLIAKDPRTTKHDKVLFFLLSGLLGTILTLGLGTALLNM